MIELHEVTKIYGGGDGVRALDRVSLAVDRGEQLALVGSSGSGKSTLLNIIGGIDTFDSGRAIVDGRDISGLGERGMTLLRRETIGIVFQFFNLMPTLSVLENVMLPAELAGRTSAKAHERAIELLDAVGMAQRSTHIPSELSGGEMQRTAIARALVNSPRILLADEPTGNLDSATGGRVLDLLRRISTDSGLTLVMATHDQAIARSMSRVVELHDGRVVSGEANNDGASG